MPALHRGCKTIGRPEPLAMPMPRFAPEDSMSKLNAFGKPGLAVGVAAALVGGCASFGEPEAAWNIPQPGSTWTVAQRNTGSYGKDIQFEWKRGVGVWQGQPAVTLTNSVTGNTIMAKPGVGGWMAIVDRDGKALVTYDPPINFQLPLKVGKAWATTHRLGFADGKTAEIVYACKVEAYEPVTVRAGTFNSYRVGCKGLGYEDVTWYSPDFGMFLKTDWRRSAEHPQGVGTQQQELVTLNLIK